MSPPGATLVGAAVGLVAFAAGFLLGRRSAAADERAHWFGMLSVLARNCVDGAEFARELEQRVRHVRKHGWRTPPSRTRPGRGP